jgi:lysophospholipase L1-like esterase
MLRILIALALACTGLSAQAQRWATVWTASAHGPYPSGNASAQPDLRFAFPTRQAHDQTFRLIVQPDLWSSRMRLRFSNAFGTAPVTFDGVFAGLQWSAAAIVKGANRPVRFGGKDTVTIPPGESAWSDEVGMPAVDFPGRKLAVSFHVVGDSGPMTWHAKALTTSYVSAPGAGSCGQAEDESAFPFTTTSWYFLDAVDAMAPASTRVLVAFGDSITDGTASTLNGDDRWPNALSRRLHAAFGDRWVVVNAGIGGNQVTGPAEYTAAKPFSGGPSARQRLERDVLSLSGVGAVIWLEGINDFSRNANAPVDTVEAGMGDVVERIRARVSGVKIVGATVVSALGSSNAAHGSPEEDVKRRQLNDFIRTSKLFNAVADFDKATLDANTGGLRPEFVPDGTIGGPGDKLHPNRAGYLAMAMSIDLSLFR